MAIRFIAGKPRGGKTLRAVFFLIEELRTTKRNIVTNLPLKLDALQEYCEEHAINAFVYDRVRLLTTDETDEFYRHRGRDSKGNDYVLGLRYVSERAKDGTLLADYKLPLDIEPLREDSRLAHGVAYFIDEIHVHFNSRKWTTVADVALWYASQHAKLGDDVWCVTQSVSNVVKQFRDLAQEFRYVRNLRKEKFGGFKVGNNFVERVHLEMQTPGTEREAMEQNKYELDAAGIAACYDTSAGVGVAGGGEADKGKDAKGFPLWLVWVGLAAAIVLMWFAAAYLPRMLSGGLKKAAGLDELPRVAHRIASPVVSRTAAVSSGAVVTAETVWMTGYATRGGMITVLLSDGRTLTERDGLLHRVERNFAELRDGTRYYLRRASSVSPGGAQRGDTELQRSASSKREGSPLPGGEGEGARGDSESSWQQMDRYGVQRLKSAPRLGEKLSLR